VHSAIELDFCGNVRGAVDGFFDEVFKQSAIVPRASARRLKGRFPLQMDSDLSEQIQIAQMHLRGEDAATGIDNDQSLTLQPFDRLAHWRAAHLQLFGQLILIDGSARPDLHAG
jgi:hypothetical protein